MTLLCLILRIETLKRIVIAIFFPNMEKIANLSDILRACIHTITYSKPCNLLTLAYFLKPCFLNIHMKTLAFDDTL